ncbi:MAG: hypothetical protein ACXWT0_00255 [Methylobacter sp.]
MRNPNGNQNAVKRDDEKATDFLHGRCKPTDRLKWLEAAKKKGMKLMPWVVATLNSNS